MSNIPNDQYFATLQGPEYLDSLVKKINDYRTYINTTGKVASWGRRVRNYHGISSDGSKSSQQVLSGGDQGQLTMLKVNDFRNNVQHMLVLCTAQRPAGEAKAINSDTKSLRNAEMASSLVEYYLSQVGWEMKFNRCAELALVVDEGFVEFDQDAASGKPIRPHPVTGKMIMTGEVKMRVHAPWNVARDVDLANADESLWWILSYKVNKFDLAAKFPLFADQIINTSSTTRITTLPLDRMSDDSDQIQVHCMVHGNSPSVEMGRLTLFIPDAQLLDGPLPYPELNVYRMSQADVLEAAFGYSNATDLMALEEMTDALYSISATNEMAFGGNVVLGPKGAGLVYQNLSSALKYMEMDPVHIDKIKVLELLRTSPEIFKMLDVLDRKKEAISGINSVIKGDPEGALKNASGSALALVQAQALQYNSGLQQAYYKLLSKSCTGLINIKRRYVFEPETIRIVGKIQAQYLKEFQFTGDDLESVSTVFFEMVSPVEKTIGGRLSMAKDLLDSGLIKNPRQYLMVQKTGSLDVLMQDDVADETAILEENEILRSGERGGQVPVIATENHEEHIKSHSSIIASPQSKADAQLVQRVQNHNQEHIDLWQQLSEQNPALLLATNQKVLPVQPTIGQPPQGPQGPGGPPGGPPQSGPGGPPPPQGGPPDIGGPPNPLQQKADGVRQPNMPKNPLTGERVPAPPGM